MPAISAIRAMIVGVLSLMGGAYARAGEQSGPSADSLVVGAGISGLCAALEAGQRGARVTVMDAASVFGGHAVMSSGMVCFVGTPEQEANKVRDSVELATKDFITFGEDANADWARFYAENSRHEVYDWLQQLGVNEWELYPQVIPGNSVRRQHVAKGRGMGLVSPLYLECLRYTNIAFLWNTKAASLVVEAERVVGVNSIHQRTAEQKPLRAQFVILATGGFESNLELVRANWPRYFPSLTNVTRLLLGSGLNSLGSGLALAEGAGASLAQLDHQLFYSTGLVDPRDSTGHRGLHAFNRLAIWVNSEGKRFVFDGQPDPKTQIPAVLRQTPATYWAIFDSVSRPEFFVSGSDWKDTNVVEREIFGNPRLAPWVKQADSITALAQAAGLPATNLVETIRRWNELIEHGEDLEFNRFNASSAERPPKLEKPPFFAVQFFPLSRKSLGGVAVDLSCRVLDREKRPIPGLYAVGELTGVGGINGRAALEGTMLGPSMLMGRLAAQSIATQLAQRATPALRIPTIENSTKEHRPNEATRREWHEGLQKLVGQPRPGYVHFQKAHSVVLNRNYECGQCHRVASPLQLTARALDRQSLTRSCPVCHGGVTE